MFSLFLWLSGAQLFQSGTNIEAVFDHIEGLRPGASIQLAGVDVGRVSRIYFDDRQVVVVMRIQRGVNIPFPAKVLISSSGVIGDKFLEIIPSKRAEDTANNKRLVGVSPVTMEQFYATAYEVLDSLRAVTFSLKSLITDPEVTNSLKNTFANIENISSDLEKITGQLQSIDIVQLFTRLNNIA
jgi:phospholipid/cholesterol/gamma-HCH transport system substrate-binding protein